MRAAAVVLVAVALAAPLAAAAATTGVLTFSGSAAFPAKSALSLSPLAFYTDAAGSLTRLSLEADEVRVTSFHERSTSASVAGQAVNKNWGAQADFHNFTRAAATLVATDSEGWLGIYPKENAMLATFPRSSVLLRPVADQRVGDDAAPIEERPTPSDKHYAVHVAGPHLHLVLESNFTYVGDAFLKLQGPDLEVRGDEGARTFATGARQPEAAGERVEQWLFVELKNATIHLASEGPAVVATRAVDVAWTGTARFASATGTLDTNGAAYASQGGAQRIDGALQGRLRALDGATAPVARAELSGDLVRTTMVAVPAPPSGGDGPAFPAGVVAMLFAAVALGAGGGLLYRRRRDAPPLDVEACVEAARLAGEAGRHGEAVDWLRRARRLAPLSARLAMDEAFHLSQMGESEASLAAYDEAAALAPDGEADFEAALVLLQMGHDDPARVEAYLVRALARTPSLVLELEDASLQRSLPDTPTLRAAIRRAYARIGEG